MHVLILGAGISGALIAQKLSRSFDGKVTIIDQCVAPAKQTSAHQLALVHPQVNRKSTKLQRFTQVANRIIWQNNQSAMKYQGVFQPMSMQDWVSPQKISELLLTLNFYPEEIIPFDDQMAFAQTNIPQSGLWFAQAGIYDLRKICEDAIAQLPENQTIWHEEITRIRKLGNVWEVINAKGEVVSSADVLILATNYQTKEVLKSIDIHLPLRPVRGQLSRFVLPKNSELGKRLPRTPLRGDGYCAPAITLDEDHWQWEVGSSYEEDQDDLTPSYQSMMNNQLKALALIGANQGMQDQLVEYSNFVGIRSASKDRLPLIGPIPHQKGLFIATAYGSRGLIWATLGAELISAYLTSFLAETDFLAAGFLAPTLGGAVALATESELAASVSPARFLAGTLA